MIVRFFKALFGALIVMSVASEYGEMTKVAGHSIFALIVTALCGLIGLLLIYSSIQDKPFFSYFKKKGKS
jgi:hypothetical protein